ncbi:MAG: hypothetical protein HC780_20915 [Leptolyngbyaceae cyanobacterium CSU_1_3]|nr:hypothetical protein [Leptolyngbyaceae cyanobacterium CSU_1_3]
MTFQVEITPVAEAQIEQAYSYTASAYRFWFRRGVGAAPPARVPPLHPVQNL